LSRVIRHLRVRANGVGFHVALSGRDEAPLLLCLHGFPECWYSWRHQLEALSDRFLVAAPDLRGYGDTERPPGGFDIRTLAADAAALARELSGEPAFLAGHDWGAMIACAAAGFHPAAWTRLVVLGGPHPAALRRAQLSPRQVVKSWYIAAMQIPWLPEWVLSRNDAAFVDRIYRAGSAVRDAFSREDLETLRVSFARPGAARAALAYYRVNLSPWAIAAGRMSTPPVGIPSLVLVGTEDPFLAPVLFDDNRRHFRGEYTFRRLPGCGHWIQQEAPDVLNAALREFLSR
jgi:pimeloyl-ACP methyl ester carboxylesterase